MASRKPLTLAQAERAMNRASTDMAAALEAFALRRLRIIAARNPTKTVKFSSAMGTWSFFVGDGPDGLRDDDPTDRVFNKALGDWGYAVIPAPVALTIKDGTLTRKEDW